MTNCVTFHFNYNYICSLLSNSYRLVWPISLRKIWCWFTYTMLVVLLWGGLLQMDSLWVKLKSFIRWHSIEFALFIVLIDPFIILLAMSVSNYPRMVTNKEHNVDETDSDGINYEDIGIIIPSHNSANIIKPTIEACLKHVNGCQIFICDNNDGKKPSDSTPEEIRAIDPTINYHYNDVGNKSRAQYMGIMSKQNTYKYTMLIDDDVILPEELELNLDLLKNDPNLQCLVYPICATSDKKSLFVEWQDLEYKLSGMVKNLQSTISTVIGPHGGISVWKTPILKRILVEGDTVFYGDDTKMGLYLLNRGFRSEMVPSISVPTRVPESLMGKMPNLYNQRVCSWDATEHLLTPRFIEVFFRSYVRGSILRTITLRFFEAKIILDILSDWLKIIVFVYFIESENFWSWLSISIGINILTVVWWNYIKCWSNPDMRCSFLSVMTFWLYKCLTSCFRVLGLIRCYLFYLPNFKQPNPISLEDDTLSLPTSPWRWTDRLSFLSPRTPKTQEHVDIDHITDGV